MVSLQRRTPETALKLSSAVAGGLSRSSHAITDAQRACGSTVLPPPQLQQHAEGLQMLIFGTKAGSGSDRFWVLPGKKTEPGTALLPLQLSRIPVIRDGHLVVASARSRFSRPAFRTPRARRLGFHSTFRPAYAIDDAVIFEAGASRISQISQLSLSLPRQLVQFHHPTNADDAGRRPSRVRLERFRR